MPASSPIEPPAGRSRCRLLAGRCGPAWFAAALCAGLLAGCTAPPAALPSAGPQADDLHRPPAEAAGRPGSAPSSMQDARGVLAPTGVLRVGVYPGSPTSMVRAGNGTERRGLAVELGLELARRLGVPARLVVFERVAEVIDALPAGQVDFTVTNATAARAERIDFTAPLVGIELGYLSLPGSRVDSIEAVDVAGVRIGVSQGSSSQGVLSRSFKHASVVPAPSLQAAAEMLRSRQIDAFATNKAILHELADSLPGARVLPGRWGLEQLAIAIPKGRDAGLPALRSFVAAVQAEGLVQRAAERAGLRGSVPIGAR